MSKVRLSTEQVQRIDRIIRGIAIKKEHTYPTISREDVEMELWVNALEIIEKYGRVDENLIAVASYRKIVDMIRKEAKTSHFSLDSYLGSVNEDDPEYDGSEIDNLSGNRFDDVYDNLILEDILNQFEVGSKERQYVEIWMEFSRARETGKINVPESAFESTAAKMMGYSGTGSSGYKRVRGNVRYIITEYMK